MHVQAGPGRGGHVPSVCPVLVVYSGSELLQIAYSRAESLISD